MCDCAAMPLDRLRRPLGARALALSRGAPWVHWGVRRVCLVDRGGCSAAEWRHEAPQARASALRQLLYARRKELLYDNTPLRATLAAAGAAAAASANAGVLATASAGGWPSRGVRS